MKNNSLNKNNIINNKTKKLLLAFLSVMITGCSAPNLTNSPVNKNSILSNNSKTFLTQKEIAEFDKEYSGFKTKALSQDYLERKVRKLISTDVNGEMLEREIEYARVIHPQLLINIIHSDSTNNLYTDIKVKARVNSRYDSDPIFRSYMDLLQSGSYNPGILNNRTITTIAGNLNINGDGLIASVYSRFESIRDIAEDSQGNIYIAESYRIRKIDHNTGIITTIAGRGVQGASGDGGLATDAEFGTINSIALDSQNNIFLSDEVNNTISRIDHSTGIINRVTGNGNYAYSGDNGPAVDAEINGVYQIALDSHDNLYISDRNNQRVRKVEHSTGIITTISGNGTIGFSGNGEQAENSVMSYPTGIAIDSDDNIYISDDNRIRKIDHNTGIISTFAGNGVYSYNGDGVNATDASMEAPGTLKIDSNNNLYIMDHQSGNIRIRKIDHNTGIINTVLGNGQAGYSSDGTQATQAMLNEETLAIDMQGNIIFSNNSQIRKSDKDSNNISTLYGIGTGDGTNNVVLNTPMGIALDSQGNIYYSEAVTSGLDPLANRVRKIDKSTGIVTTVAGNGVGEGDPPLHYSGDNGPATNALLFGPLAIAFDSHDNLYISDIGNNRIRKVDHNTGIITTVAGDGDVINVGHYGGDGGPATEAKLNGPISLTIDSQDNLYICDIGNGAIRKVDHNTGIITTVAGTGIPGTSSDGAQAISSQLSSPYDVAVDPQGNIYIAEIGNARIRKVDHNTGIITTVAGTGTFGVNISTGLATETQIASPAGIKVNSNGDIYITDVGAGAVKKVDHNTGIISTIAGTGTPGYNGNNGLAKDIQLNFPFRLAIATDNSIYITETYSSEQGNRKIRKISAE